MDRLRKSPHAALRQLSCTDEDGVLVLHGQASSYYLKQLAQESIADLKGAIQIVNRIEVVF